MPSHHAPSFTHSTFVLRCIGQEHSGLVDSAARKLALTGCGRLFIPSVEMIAGMVEHADSPTGDEAILDEIRLCEHCLNRLDAAESLGYDNVNAWTDVDGPMEYPYDYFLNMVWPEVTAQVDPAVYGWSPEMGPSGCIMWTHPETEWTLHATPFWEDSEGIALQWDHPDGRQELPADLEYKLMGDERDAGTYLRAVWRYLDVVTPGILLTSYADPVRRHRDSDQKGGK